MEQLANLLKNIKVNFYNKTLGHYREMAWLPFQKFQLEMLILGAMDDLEAVF